MQLTLDIPKDVYERLSRRASALGTTVEALAGPAVEQLANPALPETAEPPAPPADDWQRQLDAFNALIESRADRYPPGFRADVSRESMYEGCGE